MGSKTATDLTIGEVMRHFDLETPGDAWALVLESGWVSYQGGVAENPERWLVKVPEEAL